MVSSGVWNNDRLHHENKSVSKTPQNYEEDGNISIDEFYIYFQSL